MPFGGGGAGTGSGTGPNGIASGCWFWYAGDHIGSLADASKVVYWKDLSGSGNHLTWPLSVGSSVQYFPLFYNNIVNGYPALLFNGLSNYLQCSGNEQPTTSDISIFMAYKSLSDTVLQTVCANDVGGLSTSSFVAGVNKSPVFTGIFNYSAAITVSATSTIQAGNWLVRHDARTTNGGNTLFFGLDGTTIYSGTSSSTTTTSNLLGVGGAQAVGFSSAFFSGYIAEIIGYDTKLTNDQVKAIDQYLINKYLTSPPVPPTVTSISGCFVWLKADSIGLTQDGAQVQYWQDVSGSGNHCTYTTGSSGSWVFPTYHPNQWNGWPTVRFNSVNNIYGFLQTSGHSPVWPNESLNFSTGDFTSFCVFSTIDNTDKQSVFAIFDNSQEVSNVLSVGINKANNYGFDFSWDTHGGSWLAASSTTFGTTMMGNEKFMIRHDRFRQNDGTFLFGRYGADVASGSAKTSVLTLDSVFTVGNNWPESVGFIGDIAEIICYRKKLSEIEVAQVNNYLLQKYMPGNVGSKSLFMYATTHSGIYKDFPLYMNCNLSGTTNNITLYTQSNAFAFSGIPVYMSGLGLLTPSFPLFMSASFQQYPPITLFVDGGSSISSGISLYTFSDHIINNDITLYVAGTETISGGMSLFTTNIPPPSKSGNMTLFLYTSQHSGANSIYTDFPLFLEAGRTFADMPLFLGASPISTQPSANMPLYILGPPSSTGITDTIPLVVWNNVSVTGNYKKLYIRGAGSLNGGSLYDNSMTLFIGDNTRTFFIYVPAGSGFDIIDIEML